MLRKRPYKQFYKAHQLKENREMGKKITFNRRNAFFKTAVGKTVKTLAWVAVSAVVTYVVKLVAGLDWGQYAVLQPLVNTALVAIKNLADRNVPNL